MNKIMRLMRVVKNTKVSKVFKQEYKTVALCMIQKMKRRIKIFSCKIITNHAKSMDILLMVRKIKLQRK